MFKIPLYHCFLPISFSKMLSKYCRFQRLLRQTCFLQKRHSSAEVQKVPLGERVIFSGIQPTGAPHLGNYLGALKQWVELQEGEGDVYYCVVDFHALTISHSETINSKVLDMTAFLLACGVDPKRSILFRQSDIREHTMLSWALGCLVQVNTLRHLTQWKEKSKISSQSGNLGLFTYPVLQCADILLYKATHVPSGQDQTQNIELCREIARSFNTRHGQYFPMPQQITDPHSTKIRSLRDPFVKMSKSDRSEVGKILLNDSDDAIRKKIKKGVTDGTSEVTFDPIRRPGLANIVQMHSCVIGVPVKEICKGAQNDNLDTGEYKLKVAEDVIEHVRPIREEYERISDDAAYLNGILKEGGLRAKEIAEKNWKEIQSLLGLS